VAFLFFGLIPGLGAFLIKGQWFKFRQKLISASKKEMADFSLVSKSDKMSVVGEYRFFGTLESIQNDNRLWITDGSMTVGIDVQGISVYLLRSLPVDLNSSSIEQAENMLPDDEPDCLPWKKIYSLSSGIQVFVFGKLFNDGGKLVFREDNKEDLLVVIYDGKKETLLKRSIWSGRQKNEYFNQFTPISLVFGTLILLVISYFLLQNTALRLYAAVSVTLATFPVVFLIPPGVFLYFLYIHFWKRSRSLRSERDLLKLPLRYFGPDEDFSRPYASVRLHNNEEYCMIKWKPGDKMTLLHINQDMKIRSHSLARLPAEEGVNYVFGIRDKDIIKKSSDPMVEFLCIAGNPVELANMCSHKSGRMGITAALCFFSGLLINFSLVYIFLRLFLIQ